MQAHDPRHAELLQRILVGDLSRDGAAAREQLERCAACRAQLAELESLQGELEALGGEERAGVAEAAAGELSPRADARVREIVRAEAGRARGRSRRILALALAASVCALLGWRFLVVPSGGTPEQGGRPPDVILGAPGELVVTAPQGPRASFDEFRWSGAPLGAGETYRLRIDDADALDADPLVVDTIQATTWRPDAARGAEGRRVAEFFSRKPANIEWQVELVSPGGRVLAASRAVQASRD